MAYDTRDRTQVVRRFLGKFVHDVLPAALASLVGGFLLTHFGFGRFPEPPAQQTVAPASAEMMDLLRDEHALVVEFVNAQVARQKKQLDAADAADAAARVAPAPPASTVAAAAPALRPTLVALAPAKPAVVREKPAVVGASLPPLVVAQTQPNEFADKPPAASDDSLVTRAIDGTVGIKDRVVGATQRAASVIGGIPSWFSAIGDRIGGETPNPRPPANLVSAL